MLDEWLSSCGAMVGLGEERVLIGWGRRQCFSSSQETPFRPLFYFPNFFLTDPAPFYFYEQTAIVSTATLLDFLQKAPQPYAKKLEWRRASLQAFEQLFISVQSEIQRGNLLKAVPFVFDRAYCQMHKEEVQRIVWRMFSQMQGQRLTPYGIWEEGEGMIGATPELLFSLDNGSKQLRTVACAGTCASDKDHTEFMQDPKQRCEHQLVIEGIEEAMASYGRVCIEPVTLVRLPRLSHLVTPIRVQLKQAISFEEAITALHPTPALGAFPREAGMQWLRQVQTSIDRKRFGAPVGALLPDGLAIVYVAIRNVQWSHGELIVGAGCGVVGASKRDEEWQEIQVKLQATCHLLGYEQGEESPLAAHSRCHTCPQALDRV
jgi:isochorismate synthase EntC